MKFSATGDLFRPTELKGYSMRGDKPILDVNPLDKGHYIPFFSFVSGASGVIAGTIHAVVHVVAAIFDFKDAKHHIHQVGIGLLNVLRGLVAVVPIIGSGILLYVDASHLKNKLEIDRPKGENYWTLAKIEEALYRGFDLTDGIVLV